MGLSDEYSFVEDALLSNSKLCDSIRLCSALRNNLYVRSNRNNRSSVSRGLFRVTEFGLLLISEASSHASRLGYQTRTAGCTLMVASAILP